MTDVIFVQNIDNSRVIRSRDPRSRREQQWVLIAAAMTFVLLFGYAWQNFRMVRLGYQIEVLRGQEAKLQKWNRGLRLEAANLRDPVRIYALAENDLGLAPPQPGQLRPLPVGSAAGSAVAEVRTDGVLPGQARMVPTGQ